MRVGVVGCGGRGTGAAENAIEAGAEIVALADLFEDRLESCRKHLGLDTKAAFTGFDAFAKLLETDVDAVILATPPGFRPAHFEAAVAAGKHVFMEKPVAVDPAGVRRVIAAGETARAQHLAVVAGTQRRHDLGYRETIRRIRDGAIGRILAARAYWNGGPLWHHGRPDGWTDVEFQIRNWLYFCWLSGDHIVEQHVHNLDVINWAMGAHPVRAVAMGGRLVRTDAKWGNIYDHFTVDYEYADGTHLTSMCRQTPRSAGNVSEAVVGARGRSDCAGRINDWTYRGERPNPYVQELRDLFQSIEDGAPLNEARQVAEATMTAILGREAAYTGKQMEWDALLNADMDLMPPDLKFGDLAVAPVPKP